MAAAGALLLLSAAAALAAAPPALPERERAQLIRLACGSTAATDADATHIELTGNAQRNRLAFVSCAPHGVASRLLVANVASCKVDRGTWQCAPATEALQVTLPDGRMLSMAHAGMTADSAVQAIIETTRLTVPPFHKPARHMLRQLCTVSQLPESLFAGATHFVIDCPVDELSLTRHCHKAGQCRWFIAKGREKTDPGLPAK